MNQGNKSGSSWHRIIPVPDHPGNGSFRYRIILAMDHSVTGSTWHRIIPLPDHPGNGSFRYRIILAAGSPISITCGIALVNLSS